MPRRTVSKAQLEVDKETVGSNYRYMECARCNMTVEHVYLGRPQAAGTQRVSFWRCRQCLGITWRNGQ